MFNKYSLYARLYPMIILFLPFIVIGIAFSIEYKNLLQILTTLGVTTALSYLFSNLGRDMGKRKENKLWDKWGGMPTVQLMNYNNSIIDIITKQRYHSKMMELLPVDRTINFVDANKKLLEDIYLSWTKYLITHTRDIKKYPLLFNENISYGFRRNLWGLKAISIILISLSIVFNYLFQAINHGFDKFIAFPIEFYISQTILFILLFFWIFVIKPNWIKIPAFAYAERLFEAIDSL